MIHLKKNIISLILIGSSLFTFTQAQWGTDPMANMEIIMQQQAQHSIAIQNYSQQMDLYMQQQMQLGQQRLDQAIAQQRQFFIDYYRKNTNDYSTADHVAMQLGDRLYCQHNPIECQQNIQHANNMAQISTRGHQQRMNDIQNWGNTMNQIAQTNTDILDMSHNGHMNRSASQSQSQANYVQTAIYGESTYTNSTGTAYSLPVYPDPSIAYSTPAGYPLAFDYNTSTWYQNDGYGNWMPLQQR